MDFLRFPSFSGTVATFVMEKVSWAQFSAISTFTATNQRDVFADCGAVIFEVVIGLNEENVQFLSKSNCSGGRNSVISGVHHAKSKEKGKKVEAFLSMSQ